MNSQQFFTHNTWWGKILGGFFGYLIAGSTGALIGIFIGNFFDKGLFNHFSRPHWSNRSEFRESVQQVFFKATFSILGHIAKVDGRVSENEIKMARQIMTEMSLTKAQKILAQQHFSEGKTLTFNVQSELDQLLRACANNHELLKMFMDIQYRYAQVDGLTGRKIQALDTIFTYLGFSPLHKQNRFYEDFSNRQYSRSSDSNRNNSNYTASSSSSLDQAYALLEVNKTNTKAEIKRAYRRLISRNHPDKLIAQGLPAEMIKLANDKTQKITKAYDLICSSRGW